MTDSLLTFSSGTLIGMSGLHPSLRMRIIQMKHKNAGKHADFSLFMSMEMHCLGQKTYCSRSGPRILKIDIQFSIGESDDDLNHLVVALHTSCTALQGDPCGRGLLMLTSISMFHHRINFQLNVISDAESTKSSPRPHGSPCTYLWYSGLRMASVLKVSVTYL